jgi:3-phenylpropionate/trans-cinnamate dioxygenase ferredoxin subunit
VRRRVASLSQLKDGLPLPVFVEDEEIIIVKAGEQVYALFDRCSHQDFPLSLGKVDGGRIKCAAHGAEFDLASGKALTAPAFAPVRTYPVEIDGDDVYIEIDL